MSKKLSSTRLRVRDSTSVVKHFAKMFEWDLGFEFLQAYSEILCYQKKETNSPHIEWFQNDFISNDIQIFMSW